jgi:hypothetical protein
MKRVKSIMDFLVRLILFKFYFSKTIRANVFHFSYLFFFCSLRSLSLFFFISYLREVYNDEENKKKKTIPKKRLFVRCAILVPFS